MMDEGDDEDDDFAYHEDTSWTIKLDDGSNDDDNDDDNDDVDAEG